MNIKNKAILAGFYMVIIGIVYHYRGFEEATLFGIGMIWVDLDAGRDGK